MSRVSWLDNFKKSLLYVVGVLQLHFLLVAGYRPSSLRARSACPMSASPSLSPLCARSATCPYLASQALLRRCSLLRRPLNCLSLSLPSQSHHQSHHQSHQNHQNHQSHQNHQNHSTRSSEDGSISTSRSNNGFINGFVNGFVSSRSVTSVCDDLHGSSPRLSHTALFASPPRSPSFSTSFSPSFSPSASTDAFAASSAFLEVVVVGLSHHTARVDVRERLAIPEARWNHAARALLAHSSDINNSSYNSNSSSESSVFSACSSIAEAAVLSTCNRFELYLAGEDSARVVSRAMEFLRARAGPDIDPETLRSQLFVLTGEVAVWHLLRVSAGLDSLIVGEGQILSQVKRAYERGIEKHDKESAGERDKDKAETTESEDRESSEKECKDKDKQASKVVDSSKEKEKEENEELVGGSAGKVLSRLLKVAVTAGKRVRTETDIAKGAVSVSSAAVEFTNVKLPRKLNLASVSSARVSIIGAGKMARLLLAHLYKQGVTHIDLVSRTREKVDSLQEEFPELTLEYHPMDKLYEVISRSDVCFPCTSSTTTVVDKEPLAQCLQERRRGPEGQGGLLLLDISVPRNVHPDCSQVEGVFSYNVDDLHQVVEKNTAKRQREMLEAEEILKDELKKFRQWQNTLEAIPAISRLQAKGEALRSQEVEKTARKLSHLSQADLDAVDKLTRSIVNKILHGPMTHLRSQKDLNSTRMLINEFNTAFNLME